MAFPFYWFYFPYVVKKYGPIDGGRELFVLQIVIFTSMWLIYEFVGDDILRIEELKETCRALLDRYKSKINDWPMGKTILKAAFFLEFIIVVWQLVPILSFLCLRPIAWREKHVHGFILLSFITLLSTTWWTLYAIGAVKIFYR